MTTFTDQKTSSAYGIDIIQMILWLCYNDVYNNGPSSGFLLPESNMIHLNVMGFKSAYYSTQTQDTYIMLCGLVLHKICENHVSYRCKPRLKSMNGSLGMLLSKQSVQIKLR